MFSVVAGSICRIAYSETIQLTINHKWEGASGQGLSHSLVRPLPSLAALITWNFRLTGAADPGLPLPAARSPRLSGIVAKRIGSLIRRMATLLRNGARGPLNVVLRPPTSQLTLSFTMVDFGHAPRSIRVPALPGSE